MASSEGHSVPHPGADRRLVAPRSVRFVRALLWAQGILILAIAVAGLLTVAPGASSSPSVIAAILAAVVAGAGVATALRLGPGRKRAAAVAVVLEAFWALGSALELGRASRSAGYSGSLLAILVFIVSVVASVGLLRRPARRYFTGQ